MRFRLPPLVSRVSHAGRSLIAGSDRMIEANAEDALALAPHGIVPLDTQSAPAVDLANATGAKATSAAAHTEPRGQTRPVLAGRTARDGAAR